MNKVCFNTKIVIILQIIDKYDKKEKMKKIFRIIGVSLNGKNKTLKKIKNDLIWIAFRITEICFRINNITLGRLLSYLFDRVNEEIKDLKEYPSSEDLRRIRSFRPNKDDPIEFAEFVCQVWNKHYGKVIFKKKDKDTMILKLITGGWSGNEEIITALAQTMFWSLFWEKSERGGLYVFEVYRFKNTKINNRKNKVNEQ